MIMSNSEKDEFIKKRFAEDKLMVSREQVGVQIKSDIDTSKIRIRKHTYLERYLIVLLVLLLIISIFCNVYLFQTRHNSSGLANNGLNGENGEYIPQNIFSDVTTDIEKVIENREPDMVIVDDNDKETDEIVIEDTQETPIVQTEVKDNPSAHEIDEEAIKSELTEYAITIGRCGSDASELEKNTILLLVADDYFNNKVSTNKGLELSSNGKFSMTSKNVHKFLEELLGLEVNDHLDSYVNYMKYNVNSKFYSAGTESTKLKEEKYEITSIKVTESDIAGEYKAIGNINKKSQVEIKDRTNTRIEDIEANYSFEATLVENTNYTYVKYKIKDFVTELRAGEQDNITRLVGIAEQEAANGKKK